MTRHVAFLRAINTGSRRVTNPQLSEVLQQVGAVFAKGFLASGNVIFDLDDKPGAGSGRMPGTHFISSLEHAFATTLGFDVPVMLRSADQVRSIARCDPFSADEGDHSAGRLYVGLLKQDPSVEQIEQVQAMAGDRDRVHINGVDLYWFPESSEYLSELSIPAVERIVGLMTVRAHTTITRLTDTFL